MKARLAVPFGVNYLWDPVATVGLAVATDIGDAHDIHPRNKQELARRLALVARALVHGEDIEFSGPVCRSARRVGRRVVLEFDHAEGGLTVSGSSRLGMGWQALALTGPDLWTGARFGLEGGLLVTLTTGMCVLLLWWMSARRRLAAPGAG